MVIPRQGPIVILNQAATYLKQEGLLGNHSHLPAQAGKRHGLDAAAVQQNPAVLDVYKPCQGCYDATLSGACEDRHDVTSHRNAYAS